MHSHGKRGQSFIEYSLIFTLVILGVIVMGPYVLRSINAHFKIWDDEIQDSHNERFVEAPALSINLPQGCRPAGAPVAMGCGLRGTTKTCAADQQLYVQNFTPAGCAYDENCVTENICCTSLVAGQCGTLALDQNESAPPNDNCFYGRRIMVHACGTDAGKKQECRDDTNCPAPQCTGTIPTDKGSTVAKICAGSDQGLVRPTLLALVPSCTGAKCEMTCYPGYMPSGPSCIPVPTCSDGIPNGHEDGKDCCNSPKIDLQCDCPDCPHCTNVKQDADETGIDCGGSCPICQLTCRAIPKENGEAYAVCSSNEHEFGHWCTGDFSNDDAKVTVCCPNGITDLGCAVISVKNDKAPNECSTFPNNPRQFANEYCEGDCKGDERQVRICCWGSSPMPSCNIWTHKAGDPGDDTEFNNHRCSGSQYEFARWCAGNCSDDDNYVVICCDP